MKTLMGNEGTINLDTVFCPAVISSITAAFKAVVLLLFNLYSLSACTRLTSSGHFINL